MILFEMVNESRSIHGRSGDAPARPPAIPDIFLALVSNGKNKIGSIFQEFTV